MARITPGVDYLARTLVVVGPVAVVGVAIRHLSAEFEFFIPSWLLVLLSVLIIPVYTASRIIYNEISYRRNAAAMGARLVPKALGKCIGNVDVLRTSVRHWKTGYPGT